MVWFGGIEPAGQSESTEVFHVQLHLNKETVKSGQLSIKPLLNKDGQPAQLRIPDKFFYNQHFYL